MPFPACAILFREGLYIHVSIWIRCNNIFSPVISTFHRSFALLHLLVFNSKGMVQNVIASVDRHRHVASFRPYPTESEMRSGWLGRLNQLPPGAPIPPQLVHDAVPHAVKFPNSTHFHNGASASADTEYAPSSNMNHHNHDVTANNVSP